MNPIEYSYVTVSEQRNTKRIWLQGLKLEQANFVKGVRYRRDYDMDTRQIMLVIDDQGDHIVSGRLKGDNYQPIIDLCNAKVTDLTDGVSRVRVDVAADCIVISIHHFDTKQAEREDRLREHLSEGYITEGTLCVGAGMATAALHDGFADKGIEARVQWIVDRDRRYLQVAHDNNHAITDDTVMFEASLEELEPELLSPVDLVQVSLPCTGHSISGKSKNKITCAEQHATDATAVFGLMNVITRINPGLVVSENVRLAKDSASYLLIKAMLVQLGYVIHELNLDQSQSGSFENRNRYWFIAVSSRLNQLDVSNIPIFSKRYQTFGDLMEPIESGDPMWADNQYLKDKAIRDAEDGKGFANRQLVTPSTTTIGVLGRHYNKRRSTEPFVTRSDGKERLLTPVEHARVKSAPESLIKGISPTLAHECLGQGIDYNQAIGIAYLITDEVFSGRTVTSRAPSDMIEPVDDDLVDNGLPQVTYESGESQMLLF